MYLKNKICIQSKRLRVPTVQFVGRIIIYHEHQNYYKNKKHFTVTSTVDCERNRLFQKPRFQFMR